jgi:peroxisomal 3,2-trans-enoyl-CoA isomerase
MGGTDDIAAEVAAGNKAFWELRNCPKILIAAVHGASIGWGCTQLANFDLVYAHQDAFFETPFMALGLVPEAGSSLVLPREMGKTRANALLLAGERLSAQDAYIGGLITAVVQAPTLNEFHVKTLGKATRMGGYSAEALRLGKKLIADAADDAEALARAGERESRDLIMLASRPETQAILQSFGGKKKGKL